MPANSTQCCGPGINFHNRLHSLIRIPIRPTLFYMFWILNKLDRFFKQVLIFSYLYRAVNNLILYGTYLYNTLEVYLRDSPTEVSYLGIFHLSISPDPRNMSRIDIEFCLKFLWCYLSSEFPKLPAINDSSK